MRRRLHKTVVGVLTPYPISSYCQSSEQGDVLRYMFPTNGKITSGIMYIEGMPKKGVDINISITGAESRSKSFKTKKPLSDLKFSEGIVGGDRLIVSLLTDFESGFALGIWTAFMWVPEMKDAEMKQLLLQSLDSEEVEDDSAE